MKYLYILIVILLIGSVSASVPSMGTFKVNQDIELKQTCVINGSFCDSCHITSVYYPNTTNIVSDVEMTKRTSDFNYTIDSSNLNMIGEYTVNGYCDYADVKKNWIYKFEVNPSGRNDNNFTLILFIIFMIYGISFVGFFGRNIIVSIIGGMFMIGLGIYLINNGIVIYRDWITNYFSYITMGIGTFFAISGSFALLE